MDMKKLVFAAALLLLALDGLLARENVVKETFTFATKDGEELRLDRYYISSAVKQPCLIFMFGGAFARGTRDREDYIPYFYHLVSKGYTVVSIDYRLGLKNIGEVEELTDEIAAAMLVKSVEMAVDDLLDGTMFVLEKAGEWNIDRDMVIIHGSSAGAVTVLQTEYELSHGKHTGRLPEGFRYAGVIAFAGAVLTLDGTFAYGREPAPTMLMHGDADRQIPYNVLRFGNIGFYGSKWISDVLNADGIPYAFYSFEDYGHTVASLPIREYWEEIDSFLLHFIERKEQVRLFQTVKNLEMPEIPEKEFTIADFLNGNYGL